MPRNMSFTHTTQQIIDETKTVTRRVGWHDLEPGTLFNAVEKSQGLRRGMKVKKLKLLRCVSNTSEQLNWISRADVEREGFPNMSPKIFVQRFCQHMNCYPDKIVHRIEFEYVTE